MKTKKGTRDVNVIFLLDNKTLYFLGFKELKSNYVGFSASKRGIYLKKVENLANASLPTFHLENHKSSDDTLISFLQKNNGLSCNFLYHEEVYYKTHISSNLNEHESEFYMQFPECKKEDSSNDEKHENKSDN